MSKSFAQIKAIENSNKKRWLAVNNNLTEGCGIYLLTRTDEDGIKYAYIGQAKHVLTRLAQHLAGYQYIDLSLKKHGLFDINRNPCGWKVSYIAYPEEDLDKQEQFWVRQFAQDGYQLRNKTGGGQGSGKRAIGEYKPSKGYREGKEQGKRELATELNRIATKYLIITARQGKLAEKQFDKFHDLLEQYCIKEKDEEQC